MAPHLPVIPIGVLKKPLEDLYEASKDAIRRQLKEMMADARVKQMHRAIADVQKVKTMWRIDKEVKLLSFYYPSKVVIEGSRKTVNSVSEISENQNFVIQGTVGQGKSIFLRYLCIRELAASRRIPIFLELRRYDRRQAFRDFLIRAVSTYHIDCDESLFNYLADSRKLLLLLDGFDELDAEAVTHVITEIEALAQKHPCLQIVITARPDCGIERSQHFRVYQLAPLTQSDHKPFLGKIIDDRRKEDEILTAIAKSRGGVASLLTTPLLMTLLVIIYNATQDIPTSLSEFYEALFNTLLTRHDKSKPGFRRKRSTKLSDSELRRVFEAFCYAARQRDQSALSQSLAEELLRGACEVTGLRCKPEAFLEDITKVACLMQQEGFDYHFIHKSVAEFHAASFISHASEENARKFYGGVLTHKWMKWRQELEFLGQIDRVRYLRYFFVPSSLEALSAVGISDRAATLSAEQVRALLNLVTIKRDPSGRSISSQSSAKVAVSGPSLGYMLSPKSGFVAHSMGMDILRRFVLSLDKETAPPPADRWSGIGDYVVLIGRESQGAEAAARAMQSARDALARAEKELALEDRVRDFVSP